MTRSPRKRRVVAVVIFLLAILAAVFAPVLTKLDYRRIPTRASWQRPDDVIAAIGLTDGALVADLGAGDGYFVFELADAVGPRGKVFAVDVTEAVVAELEKRVSASGYDNVDVILGAVDDPRLPDHQIDVVFICNVYHHIDERIPYFRALRTDLSADGRVVIVEVGGKAPVKWLSPPGHSTSVDALEAEMSRAGYRLVETRDFLPVQNYLVFEPSG